MTHLIEDIRFAFRVLWKNPGFAAAAILTLALGIGANAAAFGLVDAWLLRPLHFKEPDRLVLVLKSSLGQPDVPAFFPGYRDYEVWKNKSTLFESLAGVFWRDYIVTGVSESQEIPGMIVTDNFFDTLGVQPQIGRTFTSADLSGPPVVVLSYSTWENVFGSSPAVLQRAITLNGKVYQVLGVMPRDFDFRMLDQPTSLGMWTLLQPGEPQYDVNSAGPIGVVGRMKPGVSTGAARGEISAIEHQVDLEYPDNPKGQQVYASSLQADNTRTIRASLLTLIITTAFVLLIACANLASLLLSRSVQRQKEMAIRAALGSGRNRLIRQLLTETLILSVLGAAVGVFLAYAALRAFVAGNPLGTLPPSPLAIDWRVLLFTLAITLITALLFGLVPAFETSRADLSQFLKETGYASSQGVRSHRLRSFLVVGEITASVILLTGASLMAETIVHLRSQSTGFQPRGVASALLILPEPIHSSDSSLANFSNRLVEAFDALPGVTATGLTTTSLLSFGLRANLGIEGEFQPEDNPARAVDIQVVTPQYFSALGIPVLQGRSFSETDTHDSQPVVIVNQSARRMFESGSSLGKQIRFAQNDRWKTVVGVVGDTRSMFYNRVAWETRPRVFVPLAQAMAARSFGPVGYRLFVYVHANSPLSFNVAREVTKSVDANVPLAQLDSLSDQVAQQFNATSLRTTVLSAFGVLGLVLCAVGIYGVISQSVARRTREIAIRMALGAQNGDILAMVLREGAILAVAGLALGAVGALFLTRLLASLLYGVTATDPVTFLGVAVLLGLVVLGACYLPARRATRLDPVEGLRYE